MLAFEMCTYVWMIFTSCKIARQLLNELLHGAGIPVELFIWRALAVKVAKSGTRMEL